MTSSFSAVRVFRPGDIPPPDPHILDVAILDMNHNWPNLGHDCIVQAISHIVEDLCPRLPVRAVSYDVRHSLMVPEPPGGRFHLYVGTGGPGHIDPRRNDGIAPESQGVSENPAWEEPLFHLFERIRANEEAALIAVCHSFGLLCLWSGAAAPVLRGPGKGGKSTGVVESSLTAEGAHHDWFSRLAHRLPDGRRLRVLDSRLFDLIPTAKSLPSGMTAIGCEVLPDGREGDALTMLELARDRNTVMPRIFAVNHHPEIVDRRRLRSLLDRKLASGEVTREWYDERVHATQDGSDLETERSLTLTSQYTFLLPLRFHLTRQIRLRTQKLGWPFAFHEDDVFDNF